MCERSEKKNLSAVTFQRDCPASRTVTQYYYPSWPDRGVPREPASLSTFTEHVRQDLEASPRLGPAVVHCRWEPPGPSLSFGKHARVRKYAAVLVSIPLSHRMKMRVSGLPVWLSCFSAGVGRSGTFVTLLWLMQLCARGIRPDIRAAVEDLRLHRMWMVQNLVRHPQKNQPPPL